jgi:hypothetical protein
MSRIPTIAARVNERAQRDAGGVSERERRDHAERMAAVHGGPIRRHGVARWLTRPTYDAARDATRGTLEINGERYEYAAPIGGETTLTRFDGAIFRFATDALGNLTCDCHDTFYTGCRCLHANALRAALAALEPF